MSGKHKTKLIALACLTGLFSASAAPSSPSHEYLSGVEMTRKLGNALYLSLDEKYRKKLEEDPVVVEIMAAPVITPISVGEANGHTLGRVSISVGFVDLLNHVAHAKAIDRIQPGYFERYVLNLGRQTASDGLPAPPDMVDPRFWTEDVLNDQASYFNQMVGLALAINFAHHYLGHFNQHGSQMLGGKLIPINDILAPAEWDAGVKAATLNCLQTALATGGGKALFEAIDKMPSRPAWTDYIVPPGTDLKRLNDQLAAYEVLYWRGGLK